MDIKNEIINNYPLEKKIECGVPCYSIDKYRYVFFWDELISKDNAIKILENIQAKMAGYKFPNMKTFIVVGKTEEQFDKSDLFFFDGANTFSVFYLINEKENRVYMNDSWIYVLGCGYRKPVRKINEIVQKMLTGEQN